MTALQDRRTRGDMFEVYKIVTGKKDINPNKFFKFKHMYRGDPELTRGLIINKKSWNCRPRANTFSIRVENPWNSLEKVEVESTRDNCKVGKGFSSISLINGQAWRWASTGLDAG